MRLDRRELLGRGAAALTALLVPSWPRRAVAAESPVLVVVYLRGGADGLQLVIPHADPDYYRKRPSIQVPPGEELDLDGFFGLHPALGDLEPLYRDRALAIVHACGSPHPTRSHFDAQAFMETAAPGDKSASQGWLNRFLELAGASQPIEGVALTRGRIASLEGPASTVVFDRIEDFRLTGRYRSERSEALERRYAALSRPLGEAVGEAFATLEAVQLAPVSSSVAYPDGAFGQHLRDAAALIRAGIGVRVVALDLGGWDHHRELAAGLEQLAASFAAGLAAFHEDLGACRDTTLTLCMTEFGRRVAENGTLGSDHGHGGILLALGGGIAGGRVLLRDGLWPGLADANLRSGDLAVTTDFRSVFAEVLERHLGLPRSRPFFRGYSPTSAEYPGLFA